MWSIDHVQTYCINLDRRPDRWADVLAQPITKVLPNFQRYSAVDGKTLDYATDPRISTVARYNIKNHTRRSHDMLDSIGGVGCALSHICLWTQLVKSSEPVYLVTEDDFKASPEDWATVLRIFASYPHLADSTTWDMWVIGANVCYPKLGVRPADKREVKDAWIQCKQLVGTQAYFVSKTGAEKLLRGAYPVQQHIDWYITYVAQTTPFKIIHNKSVNFLQRGSTSDITNVNCAICDVPTNVETSHYVLPMDASHATVLAALSIAFVVWIALAKTKSRQ